MNNSLLIEFVTEELPPLNLETNIGKAFSAALVDALNGFLNEKSRVRSFAAPRRFGCVIDNIEITQPDSRQLKRGPAINASLTDGGIPTKALLGFAKSCDTSWDKLEQHADGYFYFEKTLRGKELSEIIDEAINTALKKIPIAKSMRWGDSDYQFIRPVHNLVVMLNQEILPAASFGLKSNSTTYGHRFMTQSPIKLKSAHDYFTALYEDGKVISSFIARKELIKYQLDNKAKELGLAINYIDGLLDEVTALVEYPEVLVGSFAEEFLHVPQECLILSMAKNQKYFALLDIDGKLTNKFLFVTNLISNNPQAIIEGNQKVLSARLADAEFFYGFDQRTKLSDFIAKTKNVVYHNKLGSQFERISRIQEIAVKLAPKLDIDVELARHAALLLKADLVTEMVGEFPELQGVMGKYYALLNGENPEVANAIEKHYYPRFSGDELPDTSLAAIMALADKLESLVGIWGIGLIPSGDKDPYGLRRAALGVIRILLNTDFDLKQILNSAFAVFVDKDLNSNTVSGLYQFILLRLANYLTSVAGYSPKIVNSVLNCVDMDFETTGSKRLNHIFGLLATLSAFAVEADNLALFEANKRIENILKKNQSELVLGEVKPELFHDGAEKDLYELFAHDYQFGQKLVELVGQGDWQTYFKALASFNQALAAFFDKVMVMTDNLELRQNRLKLLAQLYKCFNLKCKLSELT